MSVIAQLQTFHQTYLPANIAPGADVEFSDESGKPKMVNPDCLKTILMTLGKWHPPGPNDTNVECLPTPAQYCIMSIATTTPCDAAGMGGMCFRHRREFCHLEARLGPLTVDVTSTQMAKKPQSLWMLYTMMDPMNSHEYFIDMLKMSTNLDQPTIVIFSAYLEYIHTNNGSLHKLNNFVNLYLNAQRKYVHRFFPYLPKCFIDLYCRKDHVPYFLSKFIHDNPENVNVHQFNDVDNTTSQRNIGIGASGAGGRTQNSNNNSNDNGEEMNDPTKKMVLISFPVTALALPDIMFIMSFPNNIHENAIAPNCIVMRHDILIGVGLSLIHI